MIRVDRIAAELAVNARLEWAVHVCAKLGIDDPVYWLNEVVDAKTLDLWIAYYMRMQKDGRT